MSVEPKLTPAEDLLMEVLIARARLGEPFWTFEYRQRPTLKRLEAKGLIHTEPASTPHIEAYLTDTAKEAFMSRPYMPPGAKLEWAVQTADDTRPVRYSGPGMSPSEEEEYNRKMAARHDGALFRRAVVVPAWERVVDGEPS